MRKVGLDVQRKNPGAGRSASSPNLHGINARDSTHKLAIDRCFLASKRTKAITRSDSLHVSTTLKDSEHVNNLLDLGNVANGCYD